MDISNNSHDPFQDLDYYLERISSLRKYVGLTIPQAAKISSMNKGQYSKLEAGKHIPSMSSISKIIKGYKITHSKFFSDLPWNMLIPDKTKKELKAIEVSTGRYKKKG